MTEKCVYCDRDALVKSDYDTMCAECYMRIYAEREYNENNTRRQGPSGVSISNGGPATRRELSSRQAPKRATGSLARP